MTEQTNENLLFLFYLKSLKLYLHNMNSWKIRIATFASTRFLDVYRYLMTESLTSFFKVFDNHKNVTPQACSKPEIKHTVNTCHHVEYFVETSNFNIKTSR